MMQRLLLLVLFSCLGLRPLLACDCRMAALDEKAIEKMEFIFLGKVVATSGCDKTAKVQFTIEKLFRGKSFASTEIEFDCSSDCQMSFTPGETWIIYATYKAYGKAEVNFCSYSRKQFADEKADYNTSIHGKTFTEETAWLEKTLGLQKLNEKQAESEQHHENIRPQGYAVLWYMGGGFLFLLVIYFLSKKMFR